MLGSYHPFLKLSPPYNTMSSGDTYGVHTLINSIIIRSVCTEQFGRITLSSPSWCLVPCLVQGGSDWFHNFVWAVLLGVLHDSAWFRAWFSLVPNGFGRGKRG